jgi:hypothetical protein
LSRGCAAGSDQEFFGQTTTRFLDDEVPVDKLRPFARRPGRSARLVVARRRAGPGVAARSKEQGQGKISGGPIGLELYFHELEIVFSYRR